MKKNQHNETPKKIGWGWKTLAFVVVIVIILLLLRSCSRDNDTWQECEPEKIETTTIVEDDCLTEGPGLEKGQEPIESEKIQTEDLSVGEDNKSSSQLNTKTAINLQYPSVETKKDDVEEVDDKKEDVSSDSTNITNPSKPNVPTLPETPQQPEPPAVEATEGEVVLKVLAPNGDPVNSAEIELWTNDNEWFAAGDTNENGELKKTIPFGVEINYVVYGSW